MFLLFPVVGDPGNGLNYTSDAGEEQVKVDAMPANSTVSILCFT